MWHIVPIPPSQVFCFESFKGKCIPIILKFIFLLDVDFFGHKNGPRDIAKLAYSLFISETCRHPRIKKLLL